MDKRLLTFVQSVVIPLYWEADGGRGARHYGDVLAAARRLVGRELDNREFLAVALHDIGVGRTGFTRDEHPRAALVAIGEDEALRPVRDMVDDEIREAILRHMADDYAVCGILGPIHELLVEADEGTPVLGEKRIEKPVKYWLDGRNKKLPPDAPIVDVVRHVVSRLRQKVDAFNSGVPPFTPRFCAVFAEEIAQASAWANGIGEKEVVEVIDRLRGSRP